MSSVCRICLADNMRLCSLKNNLLIEVYEKLSSTKFYSEDVRPRAVCSYCYQKLLRCHTFSQMVHRSERIFNLFVHEGFESVQKGISEAKLQMKQHLSVATMQFIDLDGNTTNAVFQPTIKDEPKPSVEIKDEPMSSVDIKQEVTTEQDDLVEAEWVTDSITEDCTICQSTLEDDSDEEDGDRGRNDLEELPSQSYIEQTKSDDSKIPFCCNNCNKTFLFKSKLISHIRKLHSLSNRKQYIKKCTKINSMVKAKVMPNQKRKFTCDVCNKQFSSKCYVLIHMRIHTGEMPYSCNVCDNNFNQKSSLDRHMISHTGEKTFACNICNKRFLQNLDLTRHMRIHTGERPFACKVCDKCFIRKAHLVGHMRIHTGERPFACNVCNNTFARKYNINKHMETHKREKTFPSNECDKQFKSKSLFVTHMGSHGRKKPFVCNVCDKQYISESAHVKHMRTHMKEAS